MSQELKYGVRSEISDSAHINELQYDLLYRQSIEQPELFWAEQANKYLFWFKKWEKVTSYDFQSGEISWFEGGKINASYNCLDRHLEKWGDQIAIFWEDDNGSESRQISYVALHEEVCRFANVLKSRGVEKGDRVSIYMPMIPETTVAMLACARIGAIHSVVFGGFSPDALRDRILDSDCQVVITADEGPRGGRNVPLKENVEAALEGCPGVHTTVVVRRTGNPVPGNLDRDRSSMLSK